MHSRLKSIGDDANNNSKRKYYLVTTQNISTGRVRRLVLLYNGRHPNAYSHLLVDVTCYLMSLAS